MIPAGHGTPHRMRENSMEAAERRRWKIDDHSSSLAASYNNLKSSLSLYLFVLVLGLTLGLLGRSLLLLVCGRVLMVLMTLLLLLRTLLLLVGRGNLHNNIGRFSNHLGLESLLGIGGVLDRANKAIAVHDRVAALDHTVVTRLLTILVVGEFVVLDVKSELVGGVQLEGGEESKLGIRNTD